MEARQSGRGGWPGASFDRRAFLRRSGQAGVAAGVIGWTTPTVRSLDVHATAGTPPPEETSTTPTVQGGPINRPGGSSRTAVLPGVQEAPSSGGGLAFTGAELGEIAAMGSASLGLGEIVRRKGARKRREVEAEAEANAERARPSSSTEPADPS